MKNLKICKDISKYYEVEIRVDSTLDVAGCCDLETEIIYLNSRIDDKETLLSTLFHEIGHVVAKRNRRFPFFHNKKLDIWNKKQIESYMKVAYRAERYVDQWAEKEFNKWFPDLEFEECYRTDAERKWLLEQFRPWYEKVCREVGFK